MFLALDLETTGLLPRHDKIIEVAAMRVNERGEILETFHKLIHPGVPIPHIITHLTGITNEAVEGAPSFSDIRDELAAFIGDLPILGHSVGFDIGFLQTNGITLTNSVLDTFQLAQALLPGEPSYSLEILSEKYSLPHANKHRADDDTRVAIELYKLLVEKIREIPEGTAGKISNLLQKSEWGWKGMFLKEMEDAGGRHDGGKPRHSSFGMAKRPPRHLPDGTFPERGPEDHASEGPTSSDRRQHASGGLSDESTMPFTALLFQHLTTSTGALIESPDYTPSDLLLVATHMAEQTGEHVLIATPRPQEFPPDARITHLQNPSRYLNEEAFAKLLQKPSLSDPETRLALKILLWKDQTLGYTFDTGLRYELSLNEDEYVLWEQLSAHPHLYSDREPHQDSLYGQAYKNAKYTPVLVVHTALLLENLVLKAPLIPPKTHLIIDQIETLAETALTTLTQTFSVDQFLSEDDALNNTLSVLFGVLALLHEKDTLREETGAVYRTGGRHDVILTPAHFETAEGAKILDLLAKIEKNLPRFDALKKALALKETVLTWVTLTEQGDALLKACPRNIGALLVQELWSKTQNLIGLTAYGTYKGNFAFLKRELKLPSDLPEILLPPAPTDPLLPLQTTRYQLQTHPSLPNPKTPENLPATVHAIEKILKEMGEPNSPACPASAEAPTKNYPLKTTCFLLTTSYAATEQLHEMLITPLREAGYLLLTQGMSGGAQKIAQRFATATAPLPPLKTTNYQLQTSPRPCFLLGTEKLWNAILQNPGTASPAHTIKTLFLHRLPFRMPWHPVAKEQNAQNFRAFKEITLPSSVIRLKKIFHDATHHTGIETLHVLDPRFEQYDREFAKAAQ